MFRLTVTIELGRTNDAERLTRRSWARVRNLVKKRDNAVCQYCGEDAPNGEPDHVLPLSRGGTDAMGNLVWSCAKCNQAKGAKTPRKWKATPAKTPTPELPPVEIVRREQLNNVIEVYPSKGKENGQ